MYKVVIEKIEQQTYETKSYEKVADTGNTRDGGAVYDYVPIQSTRDIETTILVQQVEDLDIESVIKAINKIV